jgi:hypothetical protein
MVSEPEIDNLHARFTGGDKLICQSLVSWLHDGSHAITDDYQITTIDDTQVGMYLRVFKKIFVELGHENHYCLMTGEPLSGNNTAVDVLRDVIEKITATDDDEESIS